MTGRYDHTDLPRPRTCNTTRLLALLALLVVVVTFGCSDAAVPDESGTPGEEGLFDGAPYFQDAGATPAPDGLSDDSATNDGTSSDGDGAAGATDTTGGASDGSGSASDGTGSVGDGPRGTTRCSSGWSSFAGHCYRVLTSAPATYDAARKRCIKRSARPVEIESAAENSFVYKALPHWLEGVWIGLLRVPGKKIFAWESSKGTYRNWDVGEPNDRHGNEDCSVIWGPATVDSSRRSRWNDAPCTKVPRRAVVCEQSSN